MKRKKENREGYRKILDAWDRPENAGDPIGCMATTFTFSSVFFEEECLSRFLGMDSNPSEDGPIYLLEREEKLSQVQCAAVMVDHHHCKGFRNLRWDLLPVRVPNALLHAKISLLCWKEYVRIIVSSANLTEDGYRRNLEIFGMVDYYPDSDAPLPLLKEITAFLGQILNFSSISQESALYPIQRWKQFLNTANQITKNWGSNDYKNLKKTTQILPLLIGPESKNAFEILNQIWPDSTPPIYADIVSPFFDTQDTTNKPATEIWKTMRKRGEVIINYFITAEDDPEGKYIYLHAPESIKKAQPKGRENVIDTIFNRVKLEPNRSLHAKAIRLDGPRWSTYMIGSSNFTSKGLGITKDRNFEANLVFVVDGKLDPKAYNSIYKIFPEYEEIDVEKIKWQPTIEEGIDDLNDCIILPQAFKTALYDCDEMQNQSILLTIDGNPPASWKIILENESKIFLSEEEWRAQGSPGHVTREWKEVRPPSGFWVHWSNSTGMAWFPVIVLSLTSLPPPQALKDLPLEVLINFLTSARPLYKELGEYLNSRKNFSLPEENLSFQLDPHKRVDTSQFLLQRTRRVSLALNALRERLEQPIPTKESLYWKLLGPVGAKAVAKALINETRTNEEKAFLLTELVLELSKVKPDNSSLSISSKETKSAIIEFTNDLKKEIPEIKDEEVSNLKNYIDKVFKEITHEL